MQKSKTHFPEVPVELAERVARLETTNAESKTDRREQLRAAAKRRRTAKLSLTVNVEGEEK